MKRRIMLLALGVVLVACFIASVLILTPPVNTGIAGDRCDGSANIVLEGQDRSWGDMFLDPAEVARCEAAAQVPGRIGLVIVVIGLVAGLAMIPTWWRGRALRPSGEPISRAIRRPEEPRTRRRRAP
jgi:hypothetical protein